MDKNMEFSGFGFPPYEGGFDPSMNEMYKDPMLNPMMQYEQGCAYYRYLCMQMDYKIKCKEYEKLCAKPDTRSERRVE